MSRIVFTFGILLGLAVWASAQSMNPPRTAEHLRLLAANRSLLDTLLDRSLELTEAGNPLERAERCRRATSTLSAELRTVAADPTADPDRVAELSEHLAQVLVEGFTPTLSEARSQIHPGSPDFPRLKKVRSDVATEVTQTRGTIPSEGKVGRSQLVRDALEKLNTALVRLPVTDE